MTCPIRGFFVSEHVASPLHEFESIWMTFVSRARFFERILSSISGVSTVRHIWSVLCSMEIVVFWTGLGSVK